MQYRSVSFSDKEFAHGNACSLATYLNVPKLSLDESLLGFDVSLCRSRNLRGSKGKKISKEHFVALFGGSCPTTKVASDAVSSRIDCL